MNVADRREFAEAVLIDHDPDHQGDTPGRCNLCDYTRHPCSTYTLAEYLLQALDAASPDGKVLIAVPDNDDWFDVCIQLRDHNFFPTDDHCKAAASLIERSEERRVGQGGRSR